MPNLAQSNPEAESLLIDPDLLHYVPRQVTPPEHAGYILPDGSIAIIGYNDMDGIFANLNALFTKTHPGSKFTTRLNGTATALPIALARRGFM